MLNESMVQIQGINFSKVVGHATFLKFELLPRYFSITQTTFTKQIFSRRGLGGCL